MPTAENVPKARHPSRRVLLSLRLFAAMLALLGSCSTLWIGIPAYRQHAAIKEIEQKGGHVILVPRGPEWLRAQIGEGLLELFDDSFLVDLRSSQSIHSTVPLLKGLPGLKVLTLAGTNLTDEDLADVGQLTGLLMLDLDNTRVTDAGLARLARLHNLYFLSVSGTAVSDAGLMHLRGITGLRSLNVINTLVTEAGIAELELVLPSLNSADRGSLESL